MMTDKQKRMIGLSVSLFVMFASVTFLVWLRLSDDQRERELGMRPTYEHR